MPKTQPRTRPRGSLRFERLLAFLPFFEYPGAAPDEWAGGGRTGKVMSMPRLDYEREARKLMKVLYEDGWIVDFDWPAWQSKASYYYRHPERLSEATLPMLRRLLTVHARQDRLSTGHVAAMIGGGHILEILRRIAELAPEGASAGR